MQHKLNRNPAYKRPGFYFFMAGGFFAAIFLIFLISMISLRWINPSFTSFTLQEDWEQYESGRYSLREQWVPADEIPEHLKWAVVASEDQLFWEHHGFDIESIKEAWQQRQSGVRNRGASTITQQVAKNLFLSPAHSFLRKGVEAMITVFIELFWPKERILEVYLNIAEFGPGVYGIGKASGSFFGIPVSSLEPEMSARLAAVLPGPKRMRVEPPSPFTAERSQWILRQMTQLSGIAYLPQMEEPEDLRDEDIDPVLRLVEEMLNELLFQTQPDTTDTLSEELLPDSLLHEIRNDTTRIEN